LKRNRDDDGQSNEPAKQVSNEPAIDPLLVLDMEQQQHSSHDDGQPNKAVFFL
jgi:hypothetical protein